LDFWQVHGLGFVVALFFFPRITLLLSAVSSGGVFWWIGWLFAPRLLVAILASLGYWDTNPFLVILTWLWALGGEGAEKTGARRVTVGHGS
jgi:hypothetical protein